MKTYPASVEEKLGFDVLRARLAGYLLSPMGRSYLDAQQPADDPAGIREALAQVAAFQDIFRFDDTAPLYPVGDIRPQLKQLVPEGATTEPDVLLQIRRVLELLRTLRGFFADRKEQYPGLFEILAPVVPLPAVEKRIAEIVEDDGSIKDSASPELRRLRKKRVAAQSRLRSNLMAELHKSMGEGFTTEAQPTLRSGRMVIPVRAEAKRKVKGFVHDVSATGQTVYIEPASCLELNNEIRSIEAEEHHELRRIMLEVASMVRQHLPEIRIGLDIFGEIDLIQAKARLSNTLEAYCTQVSDSGEIDIRAGRNPVLQLHLLAQQDTEAARNLVPLDLKMDKATRTLILTGPNAGGKTVAMKTVGLFALMLAYGMPLPADELSAFPIYSQLVVDLGDEQSIENDLSTFSSHVANLRHMTTTADDSTLVLIDEAGTGTDPAEGAALAQIIFETLTEKGATTIATTHHGALKVFAHNTPLVENGSMQFDQESLTPTYKLLMGIPGSSYAFEIASRMGLDNGILEQSRALLGTQASRMEDLLTSLEARNMSLESRLKDAEEALRSADEERTKYKELFDALEAQREHIKGKALEEAEAVISKANAQIERTIREIKESQAAKSTTREARAELASLKEKLDREKAQNTRKQQRRKKSQVKSKPTSRPQQPLQVGDQVVLDGGNSAAELLELSGKNAVIMAGSMHMRVKVSRLTKVGGPKKQQVTVRQVQAANSGGLSALQARQRIDLRGKRVEAALSEVMKLIDDAIATNLSRVEIVHGKGTGALRHAIHDYLNSSQDVERFEDAPWEEGGPGVTYAFLK
ncbi:MAG: endonuclease MutS2 [Bacteroidota bacterium]